MAYDIFLVSAIEDRDMAKLVARRLRALKFKVWLDDKQSDDTFDAKDARNLANSDTVLVLWSENAVKSDWVRAAASMGYSQDEKIVQLGLDKTVPYAPFRALKRFNISEMTSRKTPEAFNQSIDELGRRHDRPDLRAWMSFKKNDDEARSEWLKTHPEDAIAVAERKKRERKLGNKPAPAPEAAAAAALAAAAVGKSVAQKPTEIESTSTEASSTSAGSTSKPTADASSSKAVFSQSAAGNKAGTGSSRNTDSAEDDEDGLPSSRYAAGRAPVANGAPATPLRPPVLAGEINGKTEKVGWGTIGGIAAAIAAMFFMSYLFRSDVKPAVSGNMAIGNVGVVSGETIAAMPQKAFVGCPAGQIPRQYLRVLETGPIINDTEDPIVKPE